MKVIYQKVSEKTGIPEDKVQFVIEQTWKSIERAFASDKYWRILFTGLVTFKIDIWHIRAIIWKQISALKKDRNNQTALNMLKRTWAIKNNYYGKK